MSEVACPINIGPKQRQRRIIIGVAGLVVGLVVAAILVAMKAPWYLRVAIYPIFAGGATSLFQVKEKTCVALARKGVRNLDGGDEKIEDLEELEQLRRQARKVYVEGTISAAVLTGALLLL